MRLVLVLVQAAVIAAGLLFLYSDLASGYVILAPGSIRCDDRWHWAYPVDDCAWRAEV